VGVFPWRGGNGLPAKDNIIHGIGADATVFSVGNKLGARTLTQVTDDPWFYVLRDPKII